MRTGVIVSIIGHIGFVLMTMLAWEARSTITIGGGAIVPIEIVDVAAESNVRALSVDEPEGEPIPAEEPPAEEEPAPAPAERPTPQRRQNDEFNLSSVQDLVNHDRQAGRRRTDGERSDREQQGAGLGTAEVAALQDRVRSLAQRALARCWRMPTDRPDPERLVVTLEFELDRNGNLRGPPRVTSPRNYTFDPDMQYAVNNAVRAVQTCDPFPYATDPVLADHYETWGRIEFTFTPHS
ncbi:MAG: hypothetical protein KF779_17400 [Hyphomonadaceae bacterium]|nr:hypothetical protein [Hyphomonadaceae bacterium]MCA8885787.1 hypothetical protein [Hyphomonadaceae bacterium]